MNKRRTIAIRVIKGVNSGTRQIVMFYLDEVIEGSFESRTCKSQANSNCILITYTVHTSVLVDSQGLLGYSQVRKEAGPHTGQSDNTKRNYWFKKLDVTSYNFFLRVLLSLMCDRYQVGYRLKCCVFKHKQFSAIFNRREKPRNIAFVQSSYAHKHKLHFKEKKK